MGSEVLQMIFANISTITYGSQDVITITNLVIDNNLLAPVRYCNNLRLSNNVLGGYYNNLRVFQ